MNQFPCLIQSSTAGGETRFALGDPLLDSYLAFVAGRSRPNTLRAVAHDLKTFFSVIDKSPIEVVAADIFEFVSHQRGDRTVVRISDGESGLSARTIARRLSSVSGLYAYLVVRGDTPVRSNPVPRGLSTRRRGGRRQQVPLVRVPRTLPKILSPTEVNALLGALRTSRDRAMVYAMVLGGLRRCEVLGLTLGDVQVPERSLFIAEGKGGHQRVVPISNTFFAAVGDYLHEERPKALDTDRVFVTLKGPNRGRPMTADGVDKILQAARARGELERATCHQLRHTCLTRLREAGMELEAVQAQAGHVSIESTRIYLHLTDDWLADISACRRTDRCRRGLGVGRDAGNEPMTAVAHVEAWFPTDASNQEWAGLSARAPQLVATMRRYLLQLSTFLAPRSVEVADTTLRQLTRWLTTTTDLTVVADIERRHIEDYKVWLAAQPGRAAGQRLAKNTQRHRLRMIRIFLERLIEWDWPDAPGRNPILHGDIPPRSEPIPKFLTDQQAAQFMAAASAHPLARYRLVAQVLARTGLRASELCELAADAVTVIGKDAYWLRVPVGKLRNDRMIPLHADVVDLFAEWTATNAEHIRASRRLLADDHEPIDRRTVHRIVARIGAIAGIHDMHPHRLRHTLATQAINRGMRLEAIAALLGHRSLEMTLVYARIADRVVADEYASVCGQIDALYNTAATPGALPAEIETTAMTRLRQESHARMLGNGMCTRPAEIDCRMETVCETCAYFKNGPEFVPVLLRQRDHAEAHRQHDRADLYNNLLTRAQETPT